MPKPKKLNLAKVLANPILAEFTNDTYMWTGIIKSENVTREIIKDDKIRREFVTLVRKYENALRAYRKGNNKNFDSVLRLEKQLPFYERTDDLGTRIFELADKIKEAVRNMLKDNTIDGDLIWIQLCREYEEIMEKNPKEIKLMNKETKANLEIMRTGFLAADPLIREQFLTDENKYVCKVCPTIGQQRNYIKDNTDNRALLKQVIRSVSEKENISEEEEYKILQEIFGVITLSDLLAVFEYTRFGKMQYKTLLKNYLLKQGTSAQEIESMEGDEITAAALENYNDNNSMEFHSSLIADSIVNGIDYIDVQKLLLVAMIRPVRNLNLMQSTYETEEEVEFASQDEDFQEVNKDSLNKFIRQECSVDFVIDKTKRLETIIKRILETNIVSRKTRFKIPFSTEEEISLDELEKLMERFADGIYLTRPLEESFKYKGYLDPEEMSKWSDELIKKLTFSERDKYTLSMINFENLKRLYELGIIDKEYIKELLEDSRYYFVHPEEEMEFKETDSKVDHANKILKQNSIKLLKNLVQAGMITDQEMSEYIKNGTIILEMIETLDELPNERARKILTPENVLERYKVYVEKYLEFINLQKNHPEKTEEIEELKQILDDFRSEKDKARELFLKYNSDLSQEEWKTLGDELLETYYVEMEVTDEKVLAESIKILYEDELIDLENIIHLDKSYIIPMLDTLSLEDADKVKSSMTYEELKDLLDGIFEDDKFSDERKFIIVMNLLGEETEKEKEDKDFYLSLLHFDDGFERKAKSSGNRKKINDGEKKESKRYIYPDAIKWRFFKAIDPDVRVARYSNGFVEFASKLGCRIIEKYYEKNEPAYGTATFILPEQSYRKNQGDLITNLPSGQIVEPVTLREITPKKDRIAHRTQSPDKTWMDEIVKYLEKNYGLIVDKKLEEFVRNNRSASKEIIK